MSKRPAMIVSSDGLLYCPYQRYGWKEQYNGSIAQLMHVNGDWSICLLLTIILVYLVVSYSSYSSYINNNSRVEIHTTVCHANPHLTAPVT